MKAPESMVEALGGVDVNVPLPLPITRILRRESST